MEALTYERAGKVVTDSITLAAAFGKGHDKVLRDIRKINCSEGFRLANFGESEYQNKQGRKMPMYILTYEGFVFIAMAYTGSKATELKEAFISDFSNRLNAVESNSEHVQQLESAYIDSITLRSSQQKDLQQKVREIIYRYKEHVDDKGRRKYFASIYSSLKREYQVDSYRDILDKDFTSALEYIERWGHATFGESS
ncbi:Rha family transcriptional regulator [Paenalkalicoccus suaedae]|uniref:Rha family transcriptional regulator n=1 Tax=Paenalkalicoccus suaedae TaxID=2592382 RepID=A0A859FI87_9BACI|nr:Rha family transcriptional regulator [Paenalkalicoccus suaedae]QKS71935.1 Rha family transcriptional regulator [Paenalkalicoccus suaedae]